MAITYKRGSNNGLPEQAKPEAHLAGLNPTPTEWVTVLHTALDQRDLGLGSYLTTKAGTEHALAEASWTHGFLGSASAYENGDGALVFDDGLTDDAHHSEFFIQRRLHQQPHVEPIIEFIPSFLWYFQAVPRKDGGWYYLDEAGRDQDLVRIRQTESDLIVEIAALPLRRYLAARQRFLVVQYDRVTRIEKVPDPKIDAIDRSDRHHYVFHSGDIGSAKLPGFVRLLGKHLILPLNMAPADLSYPYPRHEQYPQFTIGVDAATGQPIVSTCDPDQLSDYFNDRGTPHYLTPVYFRRDVLRRYTSEPSRYQLDNTRLTCLGLWGMSIGRNEEGLVEAYLGDLGRDLPSAERGHWLSFNETPNGGLDEVRFRRDILGQWYDGPSNPLQSLKTARQQFSTALARVTGQEIYRPWDAADKIAFDGLHMPTGSEQQETDNQILTLAKGVIDYLDVKAIRKLPGADPKGTTINCIEAWVKELAEDPVPLTGPLRLLQGLRSTGVAHPRSKDWQTTLVRAGLDKLQPDEQFVKLLSLTAEALNGLAELAGGQEADAEN
ncbi:hypothetical protein [Streptomyces jumonjinensis]|uniref:Uncharacterized protein n=1 Tax=Streptomyces jumonjinensis TaxID=1945 RepID=A0A646KLH9_STRJU|nr:hypothetical protein [Streptomyces jumonjinensis]MQT03065.1 hypothetical protein [Streptomyces jumonjinensis]